MPKVWQALADALAKEENRVTLAQIALATPLHFLRNFLEYARTPMPKVWQELAAELERAPNVSAICQTALETDSTNLSGFLKYAAYALPNLAKSVNETLAANFRAQGTKHPRLKSVLRDPGRLYEAEAVFAGCGCSDLVEETARTLIREKAPGAWKDKPGAFGIVVTMLKLGRGADEQDIRQFLKTIVTADWLKTNYDKLPPEIIAIGLKTLWSWTPEFVHKHFLCKSLEQRASGLICNLYRCGTKERVIKPIELLGAYSHFRLDATQTTRAWLSQVQFNETLQFFNSGLGQQDLNAHQILFFVGLRELIRRQPHLVSIPSEIGDHVLALWRANVSPNLNHQRLNAWMIEWLERCAKANWQLVKDNIPFPDPVAPILKAVPAI
jgi:hypothetical protein